MANLTYQYLNSSVSQLVSKNPCALGGVFISSATGASMAIFDTATSTVFAPAIVSSFTPASVGFYPMPFQALTGLNVSIAGTCTYTVAFA